MNLIGESSVEKILDAAWRGYQAVSNTISALESIGLSPDGDAGKPGMSALFAAQTACEDAMLEIFGIPRATPAADKAAGALSSLASLRSDGGGSAAGPGAVRMAMLEILAGSADGADAGGSPYEVTVSMTGGMTIYAGSAGEAMAAAAAMPSDKILRAVCWEYPAATDAYEG